MITIEIKDRVWHPDRLELGYGLVKMVEESVLGDERLCQVAFEWHPGLLTFAEEELQVIEHIDDEGDIEPEDWGAFDGLRQRVGAALLYAENSQSSIFARSFTLPLPHQAFVLEKILSNNRLGHVIADDVGMGKTIEAGLLISTFLQRHSRGRILVLCPAGLLFQWQDEMVDHFDLYFDIAGRDFSITREANWKTHSLVLASLDTLKQERLKDILITSEGFDLVICDEAHRLTARRRFLEGSLYKTQNYRFIEWLVQNHLVSWEEKGDGSPRSPRLILMTGTPHQGDDYRFAYLLQLVRPDIIKADRLARQPIANWSGDEIEECVTRTPKKNAVDWDGVSIFQGHDTLTIDVPLHITEKAVLDELSRFVRSALVIKESRAEKMVRALAMHTYQKVAASSWAALEAGLKLRQEGKKPSAEEDAGLILDIPFYGTLEENEGIGNLLGLIGGISQDSKWESFLELISPLNGFRQPGEKILIFTQFRATQKFLEKQLQALGESVMQIHGGLSMVQRRDQRSHFEEEGTILISTEAGSEGANLHRKCHLMVNYDLPWNPMRLLQRIGRLDRYGQTKRVKVANLKAPESWDSVITDKIQSKLDAVQKSMGLVADDDYRSMILGGIHDVIKVPDLIEKSSWGTNQNVINEEIDGAIQEVLGQRDSIESLYRETLGMPQAFNLTAPELDAGDFRKVFSWAAIKHDIVLKESRTSEKKHLPGVYHFTLPKAFRGGFMITRECHLVFDRERYSEVRYTQLGRVRGQDIKPSLAGFGDGVTDWFVKSSLEATGSQEVYQIPKPKGSLTNENWWIAFAARWKVSDSWSGPDWVKVWGCDEFGKVLRHLDFKEVIETLGNVDQEFVPAGYNSLPSLDDPLRYSRDELKKIVDTNIHGKSLNLFPLAVICLR